MAHGIESNDIIIAATRTWHGLEKLTGRLLTVEEAIEAAKLDWNVVMEPAFYRGQPNPETDKATPVQVPNVKLAVRQTDREVLGVHTNRYTAYQFHELAVLAAGLIETPEDRAVVDTLGTLFGGKQMFMSCSTPEPFTVLGDEFTQHFLAYASHDGSLGIGAGFAEIRTVCNNTFTYNRKKGIGHNPFKKVRHTKNVRDILKMRVGLWEDMISSRKAIQEEAEKLVAVKFTLQQLDEIVCKIAPMPDPSTFAKEPKKLEKAKASVDEARSKFWRALQADDLANFQQTGWGVIQAATFLATHDEPGRKTKNWRDRRLMDSVTGSDIVQQANALVLASL